MASSSTTTTTRTPRGTRFVFEAGVKLRFSDESVATACVYYHKFYQTMKNEDYNESLVVMAVLSLAAKAREMPVKLSDIVNTCYRILHPNEPPLEVGDVYWKLKDSVASYELLLLRAIRFDIYISMPHSHLFHYLLALSRWVDPTAWTRSRLPPVSLCLLQDTYHSTLPLSLSQSKMATAVLYLAVLCCRLHIPGNNERSGRKWWEVFCPHTTESELQEIARKIMAAYDDQSPGVDYNVSRREGKEEKEEVVVEEEEEEVDKNSSKKEARRKEEERDRGEVADVRRRGQSRDDKTVASTEDTTEESNRPQLIPDEDQETNRSTRTSSRTKHSSY